MINLKNKISNWTRFQTILKTFAKHGFTSFIRDFGFPLPGTFRESTETLKAGVPKQLRKAFEELGPTFIKLGQLLSTRPDILPEEYIFEFSKLTDQISGFPFKEVLVILEKELGRDPLEVFNSIEEKPLAAASIAQVHRAVLHDGEKVVIKVQRPGILEMIEGDIQVLHFVAKNLEKVREEFRLMNLSAVVKEFQRTIYEELDFTLEARNIDQFAQNFPELDGIVIPHVQWSHTTTRILTMTELSGTPLSQLPEFPANIDRSFLAEAIVNFFFESMFFHGLFHADAHSGNILLQTEGRGRLALLDFGMVGTLGPNLRSKLSQLFMAIVSRDFESLALLYTDIGEFQKKFSVREFQADISELLSPHLGKTLKQINMGQLLLDSTKVARKYHVKLPRDLIMFYRSLMTLEHIGRKLDPEFDFLTYGQKFAQTLVKRRFSSQEIFRDIFKTVEGLRSLGTELPTQIKNLVKKIDNEDFSFGNEATERTLKEFQKTHRLTLLSFFTIVLMLCSTLISTVRPGSPIEIPLWVGTLLLSLFLLLILVRRK
ncbi:MAG: Ubiquinone biosynthesis protein [Bacteriovoracaceae bacterium]|nr:Ubiquinone biosynthesis protein [Bacteriovoracaceae bacterium]